MSKRNFCFEAEGVDYITRVVFIKMRVLWVGESSQFRLSRPKWEHYVSQFRLSRPKWEQCVSQFRLSRPKYQEYYICSHNVHANSGWVNLNYHPKWSIVGSTSLDKFRRKTKCHFFTWILQLSSGFHFILGLIVCFMCSQFSGKLSFIEYLFKLPFTIQPQNLQFVDEKSNHPWHSRLATISYECYPD
jgi:hypothetical protein